MSSVSNGARGTINQYDLRLPPVTTSDIQIKLLHFPAHSQELIHTRLHSFRHVVVFINSTIPANAFPATVVFEVRYIFVIVLFMVERELLLQLVGV